MKKNLLLLICLLITVTIPAQEVSRNLNPNILKQGLSAQPDPFKRTSLPVMKSVSEVTGYVMDSVFTYNFNAPDDSVLLNKELDRYTSQGIRYFLNFQDFDSRIDYRNQIILDETGSLISVYSKYGDKSLDDNIYQW